MKPSMSYCSLCDDYGHAANDHTATCDGCGHNNLEGCGCPPATMDSVYEALAAKYDVEISKLSLFLIMYYPEEYQRAILEDASCVDTAIRLLKEKREQV